MTVVKNWDDMSECMFAEKQWVNPGNIDEPKGYEKGDFLRVWCLHNNDWCECETEDPEYCTIFRDHSNE